MNNLIRLVSSFKRTLAMTLGFVGMSATLATLLWLGITHLQSRVSQAQDSISERLNLIETATELQITADSLEEQVRLQQTNMLNLRAKFPNTADEAEFLQQLSEMAVATGVSIGDFRPGGISKLTSCKTLELKIRGTAPYASLCRWLAGLSELPRVVRLSQLSVCGPVTPHGDCTIDIQLNLVFGIDATQLIAGKAKL